MFLFLFSSHFLFIYSACFSEDKRIDGDIEPMNLRFQSNFSPFTNYTAFVHENVIGLHESEPIFSDDNDKVTSSYEEDTNKLEDGANSIEKSQDDVKEADISDLAASINLSNLFLNKISIPRSTCARIAYFEYKNNFISNFDANNIIKCINFIAKNDAIHIKEKSILLDHLTYEIKTNKDVEMLADVVEKIIYYFLMNEIDIPNSENFLKVILKKHRLDETRLSNIVEYMLKSEHLNPYWHFILKFSIHKRVFSLKTVNSWFVSLNSNFEDFSAIKEQRLTFLTFAIKMIRLKFDTFSEKCLRTLIENDYKLFTSGLHFNPFRMIFKISVLKNKRRRILCGNFCSILFDKNFRNEKFMNKYLRLFSDSDVIFTIENNIVFLNDPFIAQILERKKLDLEITNRFINLEPQFKNQKFVQKLFENFENLEYVSTFNIRNILKISIDNKFLEIASKIVDISDDRDIFKTLDNNVARDIVKLRNYSLKFSHYNGKPDLINLKSFFFFDCFKYFSKINLDQYPIHDLMSILGSFSFLVKNLEKDPAKLIIETLLERCSNIKTIFDFYRSIHPSLLIKSYISMVKMCKKLILKEKNDEKGTQAKILSLIPIIVALPILDVKKAALLEYYQVESGNEEVYLKLLKQSLTYDEALGRLICILATEYSLDVGLRKNIDFISKLNS